MPKLNAVLMVVLAVAVIAATGFLALRPTSGADDASAQASKLLRKLADSDPDVRLEGEAGLRSIGPAALGPLLAASKSPDRVLAGRAAKMISDLNPLPDHRVSIESEDYVFEILCSGAPENAQRVGVYLVQLKNRSKAPVLVAVLPASDVPGRLAWFEVEDDQGRRYEVDAKPLAADSSAPEVISVPPGTACGLFGGWKTLPPHLSRSDVRSVRFVYDASAPAYREAAGKAGGGALLPPERLASKTFVFTDAR
jgi:hypothetical protein